MTLCLPFSLVNYLGYCMSQPLPTGKFRWDHQIDKFSEEFVKKLGLYDKRGYALEVMRITYLVAC